MSHTTYLIPCSFALPQNPQSRNDSPATAPTGGATPTPGATGATTQGEAGQGAAPAGPCADSGMLWMMPLFLVMMYFFMIRPEQKRRKEQQELLSSIKQGDKVVTLSGMHGVVSKLDEHTVTLRVDSIEMTFDRSAVARIVRDEAPAAQ